MSLVMGGMGGEGERMVVERGEVVKYDEGWLRLNRIRCGLCGAETSKKNEKMKNEK